MLGSSISPVCFASLEFFWIILAEMTAAAAATYLLQQTLVQIHQVIAQRA